MKCEKGNLKIAMMSMRVNEMSMSNKKIGMPKLAFTTIVNDPPYGKLTKRNSFSLNQQVVTCLFFLFLRVACFPIRP